MRREVVGMLMVVAGALCAGGGGCGGGVGSRPVATPGDMPEGMKAGSAAVGEKSLISGYRPVTVRVHPLTRLEMEGASRHLVLQVELLDAFGHTCKWPGIVRVELKGATVGGAEGQANKGGVWWMDLRQPEVNAQSFDGITQTYVLRVPVKGGEGGVEVNVSWTEGDGTGAAVTMAAAPLMVK